MINVGVVRVSLLAAQINPATDFFIKENLIDNSFLAVTTSVRFLPVN